MPAVNLSVYIVFLCGLDANIFRTKFEECQEINKSLSKDGTEKLADGLEQLNVRESEENGESAPPSTEEDGEKKEAAKTEDEKESVSPSNSSSAETGKDPPIEEKSADESKTDS